MSDEKPVLHLHAEWSLPNDDGDRQLAVWFDDDTGFEPGDAVTALLTSEYRALLAENERLRAEREDADAATGEANRLWRGQLEAAEREVTKLREALLVTRATLSWLVNTYDHSPEALDEMDRCNRLMNQALQGAALASPTTPVGEASITATPVCANCSGPLRLIDGAICDSCCRLWGTKTPPKGAAVYAPRAAPVEAPGKGCSQFATTSAGEECIDCGAVPTEEPGEVPSDPFAPHFCPGCGDQTCYGGCRQPHWEVKGKDVTLVPAPPAAPAGEGPKCRKCGLHLNAGEAKVFVVCSNCWRDARGGRP